MEIAAVASICAGLSLGPAPPGDRAWRWPVRPVPPVVRGFDPPARPWLAGHRGVDLAARPGQPVLSAGAGRVSYAGALAGRGVVAVSHGSLRTTYLPVRPSVRAGQWVRAGDRLGVLDGSGGHCGPWRPCLHWGAVAEGSYVDPLSLLGLARTRLLPVWETAPPEPAGGPPRRPPPATTTAPVPSPQGRPSPPGVVASPWRRVRPVLAAGASGTAAPAVLTVLVGLAALAVLAMPGRTAAGRRRPRLPP